MQARYEELRKDLKEPEKLTRTELAKKQAELLKQARTAYADRLAKMATCPNGLRPWADAERLYLQAKADADPKPLAAAVWAFLGDAPKAQPEDEEPTPRQQLDDLLHDRYLAMALALAVRKDADPELVERTLKYLDAGIAAEPNEPAWKAAKFQLLVALDRPKDLETALAAWVKAGDADGRWRTALGYLLAEQGRINEAIPLFEAVEKADDLGFGGYRTLAGWYMAVNKKDAHDQAQVNAYKTVDENTLQQMPPRQAPPLAARRRARADRTRPGRAPRPRGALREVEPPAELPAPAPAVLPGVPRLPAAGGDDRRGDRPVRRQGLPVPRRACSQSSTSCATRPPPTSCWRGSTRSASGRQTPTDLRALDLLEMQVRRRAAEVINQPGPHAAKALEAMRRAFDRPWADGEPLMMSNLLRSLGHISRKDLAEEQLRELRELHAGAKPNTTERLHMANNLAVVLGYQGRHEGRDRAAAGRRSTSTSRPRGGFFQPEANGPAATLVSMHEELNRHATAEELLLRLLKKPGQRRRDAVALPATQRAVPPHPPE